MIRDKLPNLFQFLAVYFNQDWGMEYPSVKDAIQGYLEDTPEPVVRQVIDEIGILLDMSLDEDHLGQALVNDLGCYYYPPSDELTFKEWLHQVRDLLVERIKLH